MFIQVGVWVELALRRSPHGLSNQTVGSQLPEGDGYAKEIKQLKLHCRFGGHSKNRAKARKAIKRFKTIAGRLVRELERKLPADVLSALAEEFGLFHRVPHKKRGDKHKLYSLHEPHVYCMSKGKGKGKGKEQKGYEFGVKASVTTTRDSKIILGAMAFNTNLYDGHTLPAVLLQIQRLHGHVPTTALCDRGYRGKKKFHDTSIKIPSTPTKESDSAHNDDLLKRFSGSTNSPSGNGRTF